MLDHKCVFNVVWQVIWRLVSYCNPPPSFRIAHYLLYPLHLLDKPFGTDGIAKQTKSTLSLFGNTPHPSSSSVGCKLPSSRFGLKYDTSFRQTPSVSLCACVLSSEDTGGKAGGCAHSAGFVLLCIYIARRTAVQLLIKRLSSDGSFIPS